MKLVSIIALVAMSPVEVCAADDRPNILLIVADDLGYADLGSYGGDIKTPNIDSLANEGLLFTQFHTAPTCSPTRAMLLSGNNNHVAGVGRQGSGRDLVIDRHLPGYETHLSDRITPLPALLRDSGYHTYTVGKWHLGIAVEHSPKAAGFERSFNLMNGASNHFNSLGIRKDGSTYRDNGETMDWPEGAYSTELYTDKMIEFIDADGNDDKPFFAFVAYTTPHWPLQVPTEYLNKYAGHYDEGYDALRERRFESLQRAGIIPATSTLPPRLESIHAWSELSEEEKKREARKMELYAAMVENLDFHVGRLLHHLDKRNLSDNTLIVFMSDNGAAAEDFYHTGPFVEHIQDHHDNGYDNMGKPSSFVSYGPQWAKAGSAPFDRYKGFTSEGGITAPMIISGRGVSVTAKTSAYVTVMDIAPTFLELADAHYPSDGSVMPMLGSSITTLLSGEAKSVHDEEYATILFHWGYALVRQGHWKLTTVDLPFQEKNFALYNLATDPGETTDLAAIHPERLAKLIEVWRTQRKELGITLPEDL